MSTIPLLRRPSFHKRWMKVSAITIAFFGPIFFLGAIMETSYPAHFTLDMASWPIDGSHAIDTPASRFLSAFAGAFLLGWSVTIWLLSAWLYDLKPNAVRKIVLIGLLTWFVIDCTGSVLSGNPYNVLFNVGILLVGVGPLWVPAHET